jgi:hypothetical protein
VCVCCVCVCVCVCVCERGQSAAAGCRLRLLSKPLTGPETSGVLIDIVSGLSIAWVTIVEFVADRASTNQVAFTIVKGLASNRFLAGCMPHTLSHVGENSDLAILRDFPQHQRARPSTATSRRPCGATTRFGGT